ncbi:magnesium transporter protein 1-like [Halichondria panicea]|uniref:magnesium transporter protein 1-like n=1 Tax=Halichondria panicea TaxID=6063 RepID=UPI00312B4D78
MAKTSCQTMKLISGVLFTLMVLFVIVNSQKSSKNAAKLESRVSQLLAWNQRRPIITLSSEKFTTFVKNKPRNYSIIATFTALKPQRQCSVCKEAFDEFTILASSWRYSQQYSSQLFFVMIDIDEDGMDAFQLMHLTTAPTYFHFPASGKKKPEDKYDIGRQGYQSEPLAKWVAERTGIQIAIMRPPNYTLLMIWVPVILLGSVIGYMKRENLHILFNTKYWAAAAMVWVFVMISGQMWNHIRGPPFSHRNPQTGEVGYFSGTSQYQFIAETYFIFVLYAVISGGVIMMNEKFVLFEDLGIQKVTPMVGLGIVVIVFGYLLSIFRLKYQGYPYSFLFR